ncbi:DUF2628 domain-containing protein [Pelagibacterium montanilacus]|uniref:DUF2628 domain-containing protein n=1 Tax=Pelagibacterium montanilacus TaxID=2185280 RepID=UPI000F8CC0D5|nr:DUF2628 domain-containing protein [Pelagibacterium montanilacus]
MTLYTLHTRPEDGPEAIAAVPERFIWSAFLFTPLWALWKGALLFLALWAVVTLALFAASGSLGPETAIGLYGVFALWSGFAAPAIVQSRLTRAGWIDHGGLVASAPDLAVDRFLAQRYGPRS